MCAAHGGGHGGGRGPGCGYSTVAMCYLARAKVRVGRSGSKSPACAVIGGLVRPLLLMSASAPGPKCAVGTRRRCSAPFDLKRAGTQHRSIVSRVTAPLSPVLPPPPAGARARHRHHPPATRRGHHLLRLPADPTVATTYNRQQQRTAGRLASPWTRQLSGRRGLGTGGRRCFNGGFSVGAGLGGGWRDWRCCRRVPGAQGLGGGVRGSSGAGRGRGQGGGGGERYGGSTGCGACGDAGGAAV